LWMFSDQKISDFFGIFEKIWEVGIIVFLHFGNFC
jgi:hypothetical protein